MSPGLFTVALIAGAAALAFWTSFRFPAFEPGTIKGCLVNAVLASIAVLVVPIPTAPGAWQLVMLLGLFLPALVYAFLSAIWLLRSLQGALLRS